MTYLSAPLVSGRLTSRILEPLVDKIRNKVAGRILEPLFR